MSQVHASAVIDSTATIGQNVIIGANCVIGKDVVIGDECILDACVVIGNGTKLGNRNQLFANCVIGKSPQLLGRKMNEEYGELIIGDDNVIRENVTIHPGMHPGHKTIVGNQNLIMIGVHLGHDVTLEDKIVMSNHTQISGHCKVCTGAWLSGMVQVHQFTTINKWVYASGFSGINHDIPPFLIVSGHYPPVIRAINKRGLLRAGLTEQQQSSIYSAYKQLYRKGGVLLEKAKSLFDETDDPNVKDMCETIINSSKQRFGRYLELFR